MNQHSPSRVERLRQLLAQAQVDGALIGPGATFRYLTGRRAIVTERFVGLLVTGQRNILVVPRLQQPLYEDLPNTEFIVWDEHEEPLALLAARLKAEGIGRLTVDDTLWSLFLLKLAAAYRALAGTALDIVPSDNVLARLREIKDADEIALMQAASAHIDNVWRRFLLETPVLTGHSEFALRNTIERLMREEGFDNVAWIDVGAGANGASPLHHGSETMIHRGEPVVFDFAGSLAGYQADICRVAAAGEPDEEYLALYDVVLRAQEAAFRAIRPGREAQDIDRVARDMIADAGYGEWFTHRVGHGIGMEVHEEPYLVAGNRRVLEVGAIVSVEPGVYIPGKWGVRIEDIVVVTPDGAERLNAADRALAICG